MGEDNGHSHACKLFCGKTRDNDAEIAVPCDASENHWDARHRGKLLFCLFLLLFGPNTFARGVSMQKEYFFSPLFVFNDSNHNIKYRYLVKERYPITLFSIDNHTNEIYISEKYDNNGQYVRIVNNQIDFNRTQGVFQLDRSTWILFSNFKFCGLYYKSNNLEGKVKAYSSVKMENLNRAYFMYIIHIPEQISFSNIYSHRLYCYEQMAVEGFPEAYLEAHFYFDSPISYLIKNCFYKYFFEQLKAEFIYHWDSLSKTEECNYPIPKFSQQHPR